MTLTADPYHSVARARTDTPSIPTAARKTPKSKRPPVREEERTPCPVCHRSFSRQEHMYRHLLIHQSQEDGTQQHHICPVCSKDYSRKDALLRHQQTHGPEVADVSASTSQLATSPQWRVPAKIRKACERCSRMKIRCDGQRPCQKCASKPALAQNCIRHTDEIDNSEESVPSPRRLLQSWRVRHQGLSLSQSSSSFRPSSAGYHSDDDVGTAARQRNRQGQSSPAHLCSSPTQAPTPSRTSLPKQTQGRQSSHLPNISSSIPARLDRSTFSHLQGAARQPSPAASSSMHPRHVSCTADPPSSSTLSRQMMSSATEAPTPLSSFLSMSPDHPPHAASVGHQAAVTPPILPSNEPAGVSFCDEVEMISANDPTPSSDFGFSAMTPSQQMPLQDFSFLRAPDDILAMSDLEWLFASPGSMPSVGLDEMSDPFGLAGLDYHPPNVRPESSHIANGSVWAREVRVSESQPLYGTVPPDNLLDMLAGAATLDVPDVRPQGFIQPTASLRNAEGPRRMLSSRASAAIPVQVPLRPNIQMSSAVLPEEPSLQARKRQRRLEPQDLTAPSRRASPTRNTHAPLSPRVSASTLAADQSDARATASTNNEASQQQTQWPNSWYPEKGSSQFKLDHIAPHHLNATSEIIAEESSCQVPPIDATSVLKLHALADYVVSDGQEEQTVRSILKTINVETYDIMLQLFFERFHPRYCFLHQPSFYPANVHPLLLAACCAVGCSFSQMPNARLLAEFLCDTVHSAVIMCCSAENLHARSLSVIQALCLVGIAFGSSGNRRLLEHAEAQRSALATMVRRCHLLEHQRAPDMDSVSGAEAGATHAQWQAWLHWEGIKRTSWACVVADLEFSAAWKMPSVYSLEELRAELPQSDRKWMAPTATMWKSYRSEAPLTLPEAHDRMQSSLGLSGGAVPTPEDASFLPKDSLLVSKILSCTLHLYASSLRAFDQHSLMSKALRGPLELLQDLLIRSSDLAASCHGYHPGSGDGPQQEDLSSVSFEQMTHFVHLSLKVDLSDIQKLGGRKGSKQANAALLKVHQQRLDNPKDAEMLARSCGRIVHLARHYPAALTYSINIVFFASLYLYAFSRSLQRTVTPTDAEGESIAAMPAVPVSLDAPNARLQASHDEHSGVLNSRKRFQLRFIGDLAGSSAPLRILKTYSTLLQGELSQRTPGASAIIFGKVLADLALGIERQQRLTDFHRAR